MPTQRTAMPRAQAPAPAAPRTAVAPRPAHVEPPTPTTEELPAPPAQAERIDAATFTAEARASVAEHDAAANIYDAIHRVMEEVGYVRKGRVPGLNYSFAGEAALIKAIRPAMVEQGIVMVVDDVTDVRWEKITTDRGASMWSTTLKAKIRFLHVPTRTDILVCAIGEGRDSGDKSHNKAMTGAYKYALRQTFCIETGDDPDKSDGTGPKRQPSKEEIRADIDKAKAAAEARRNAAASQAKPAREPLAPLEPVAAVETKAEPQAIGAVAAAVGAQAAAARLATANAAAAQLAAVGAVAVAARLATANAAAAAPATTVLNSPATLLKMVNAATDGHYQGVPHLWNAMREKDAAMTQWPRPADTPAWNECARFLIARVVEAQAADAQAAEEELPV